MDHHFSTCDLCDANKQKLTDGALSVLPPVFKKFGKRSRFSGPARTLKVFEDNVLVRAALETPGEGSVLVAGHQPTLGRVAALVLTGQEQSWSVKKGSVWWLSLRDREEPGHVLLRAVMTPQLLAQD